MTEFQPWERLKNETAAAWEAFCAYRDLGADRSIVKAARKLGKSEATLDRWCKPNMWVARCHTWDIEQDRRRQAANTKAIEEMAQRHVALAQEMYDKVKKRIAALIPEELDPREAAHWAEVAAKLERQALGADNKRLELTGKDGKPIEIAYLERLDENQLLAVVKEAISTLETHQGVPDGEVEE